MGYIGNVIDRLPNWLQAILWVVSVLAGIYSVVHYGFWSTFLHFIFSPNL